MTVRDLLGTIGAAASLFVASPAQAQYSQGQDTLPLDIQQQDLPEVEPEPLEGAALWDFARCITARNTVTVTTLLAAPPRSEMADMSIGGLLGVATATPCLADGFPQGGLAIDRRRLRGSLSQALYLANHPSAAPATVSGATPTEIPVTEFNARMAAAADPVDEAIRIFADCVVANNAMAVDRLARSEFGSNAEMAAISAIQPSMGPCLWEGRSIAFNRETLRAALAAALYRKSVGVPVTAEPAQQGEGR